jgi:macrolide transport system ATP-binding/permease protein
MTPPRLARWALSLALPKSDRRVLPGDLDEEFRDLARTQGKLAAYTWYWRQAIASLPYAVRLRLGPIVAQVPGDVRYALRMWRKHPAFAAAAMLTQAIGIAVAIAVIAVAYSVLLRPLPYPDAERIVQIFEGTAMPGLFSHQDFIDFRAANRSFEAVAGFSGGSRTLTTPGSAPERVVSAEVTDAFFDVLGVQPLMGRGLRAQDLVRGAPNVVIISHPAWLRRFGGDPSAVGRTLTLGGQPHTIIAVLPPEFSFPLRGLAELWLPLRVSPQQEQRGYWHWMDVIGRVKPDMAPAHVHADLGAVAALFASRDAKWHGSAQLRTVELREVIVGGVRPTIQALLAGVVLVLLATCATIAGLLLSRATARSREFSVRSAIGASRWRIARQLVTETLLLSLAGALIGIAGAHWLLRGLVALVPSGQRAALPYFEQVGIDPVTTGAALLLTLTSGLLFGVAPAVRAARDGSGAHTTARATAGVADNRTRFALVSVQVAVAFVLLSGAALLGTSVYRLLNVSPGFDPEGLVTMRLTLGAKYPDDAAVNAFVERLQERFAAIPGVRSVAAVSQSPLTGRGDTGSPSIVGKPWPPGEQGPEVGLRTVSANYFESMGIPVVRGRAFATGDGPKAPLVILINQLLADRLFPGTEPIGRQITFEFAPEPREIIGIVGNEQVDALDQPLTPVLYFPERQDSSRAPVIMVRTAFPATLPLQARAALAEIDPDLPLFAVRSMQQIASDSTAVFMRRTALWLLGVFAGAALLLAAVALYGVLAQAVAERTREIGVRLALGATRASISGMVLRRGLLAAAAGIAVGVGAAVLVAQLLTSLLFGIQPRDPLTLAACAAFLCLIATIACVLPSVRATRIDPATALRTD